MRKLMDILAISGFATFLCTILYMGMQVICVMAKGGLNPDWSKEYPTNPHYLKAAKAFCIGIGLGFVLIFSSMLIQIYGLR